MAILDVRLLQNIRTSFEITFARILREHSMKFEILTVVCKRLQLYGMWRSEGRMWTPALYRSLTWRHITEHMNFLELNKSENFLTAIHFKIIVFIWKTLQYICVKIFSYILYEFSILFFALKCHELMASEKIPKKIFR